MSAVFLRMPLVDALKAIASQLIVLHHLAVYGPMSDAAFGLAPNVLDWLYSHGRIAVQVFFVISGFLAARSLAPEGEAIFGQPLALIWRRYRRLVVPYLVAIAFAVLCAAIARAWMELESVPAAPGLPQLLAHALLLQGPLGYEALSAGVWYIAIDFQLFALMVATLWLAQRLGRVAHQWRRLSFLLVSVLAIASLFHFNRDSAWDNWALYFFGSYALGAMAFWAADRKRSPLWLGVIAAVVIASLLEDFRLRIAVALVVALALGIARRTGLLERCPETRSLAFLGRISYSVFLVHYPVCLVVNAAFTRFAPDDPSTNLFGMFVAWAASIVAGAVFFRHIERRTNWRLLPSLALADCFRACARVALRLAATAIRPLLVAPPHFIAEEAMPDFSGGHGGLRPATSNTPAQR